MARIAKMVFTEPGDIERLEGLVAELPTFARVRITQTNGDVVAGVVVERPAIQVFEDDACEEGINAEVRIDDGSGQPVYLWLGDIEKVESIDTAT